MNTHKFYKAWLKVTAIAIAAFAPVFFFGSMVSTAGAAAWTLDFLSFPLDGNHQFVHPSTRFLSALTGGFLLGWGVMVWCLSVWVYDYAPEKVRRTVLAGILSWFCLDSLGSFLSGNASNVLFNILVLILAVGPLWKPAKN
jgi:hypothetical protein